MRDVLSIVAGSRSGKNWLGILAPAALFLLTLFAASLRAQDPGTACPNGLDGLPDLVGGLKQVQGCLGVETARTASGKHVIFAWFEDKEACLRWYYSDAHREAQEALFPERTGERKPMQDVPDEVGPILAIASLTPADPAQPGASGSPFSQMAIELYTPLEGGVHIGGTFAPASMKIPKRKVIVDED